MKVFSCLLLLFGVAVGTPYRRLVQPKYDLGCELCVDIVTDLDNWITGDETEDEIVQFVEQICEVLGIISQDLETACDQLIESFLPQIVDDLVNQYLSPQQVCQDIGLCDEPTRPTERPTEEPTRTRPTEEPTRTRPPTEEPTRTRPTEEPTRPSDRPTDEPTRTRPPTEEPTRTRPTEEPTRPSDRPTEEP